jgi:hypothetical protein
MIILNRTSHTPEYYVYNASTPEQIAGLHRQYAPSDVAFDLVFTQCRIVSEIAA